MPSLRDTPIEALTEADLRHLVAEGVPENRQLEYKRDMWVDTGDGQKEFLKDLAALANAQGGDIVVGIAEQDHVPIELVGVEVADFEGLLLALENRYRSRIEPPVTGVRMRWVGLSNGRQALVIRVPSSLRGPHRDRQNGHFPIRGERRVDQMSIDELRDAFLGSEQVIERLRKLHLAAVDVHNRPELPFVVHEAPAAVVSVMPLDVLRARRDLPLNTADSVMCFRGGVNWTVTLEGILWSGVDVPATSFCLTHRLGWIDTRWGISNQRLPPERPDDQPIVYPAIFETGLQEMVSSAQVRFRSFGITGPWMVMTSLAAIGGAALTIGGTRLRTSRPTRRATAHLPEIMGETIEAADLLPVFRSFWRVFGEERPVS